MPTTFASQKPSRVRSIPPPRTAAVVAGVSIREHLDIPSRYARRPRWGDPHGRIRQWRTLLGHRRGNGPAMGAAPWWAAWGGAAAAGPPGSLHTPSRQRQPIARAHPESVPQGHRPLARECDAGGSQVQAAVSVSGRYILTNGFSLLQTI